jgi:hypothetical protein
VFVTRPDLIDFYEYTQNAKRAKQGNEKERDIEMFDSNRS